MEISKITKRVSKLEFELGAAFFREKRYDDAIRAMKRSIEIIPNAEAYSNLGAMLHATGNTRGALQALQTGISVDSSYMNTYINMGMLLMQLGKYEHAVEVYSAMKTKFPDETSFYGKYALALKKIGKLNHAIQTYKELIEKKPDDQVAREEYIKLLLSEDPAEALKECKGDSNNIVAYKIIACLTEDREKFNKMYNVKFVRCMNLIPSICEANEFFTDLVSYISGLPSLNAHKGEPITGKRTDIVQLGGPIDPEKFSNKNMKHLNILINKYVAAYMEFVDCIPVENELATRRPKLWSLRMFHVILEPGQSIEPYVSPVGWVNGICALEADGQLETGIADLDIKREPDVRALVKGQIIILPSYYFYRVRAKSRMVLTLFSVIPAGLGTAQKN